MAQMTTPNHQPNLPTCRRPLKAERHGAVAVLRLNRAAKRNALDDEMVRGIGGFFAALPDDIGAVVLAAEGEHFSAGLDLTEVPSATCFAGIAHSRSGIARSNAIEFGKAPVVAVLHGAVVGGGLELAAASYPRGGTLRVLRACRKPAAVFLSAAAARCGCRRLIGTARMMDMMLTGRTLSAEEGQRSGSPIIWSTTAKVSPKRSNWHRDRRQCAVHELRRHPHAAAHCPERSATGFATEALTAAIAQGDDEAKARLKAFLEKRGPKVVRR